MGVPVEDVWVVFNLAEEDGTGSQAWAALGLAGSNGGAFKLFLGIDEIGCACRTSFWDVVVRTSHVSHGQLTQLELGSRNRHQTPSSSTSFIRRHLFRNTPSIRFRRSMMLMSCLALVGFAA